MIKYKECNGKEQVLEMSKCFNNKNDCLYSTGIFMVHGQGSEDFEFAIDEDHARLTFTDFDGYEDSKYINHSDLLQIAELLKKYITTMERIKNV